MRSPARFWRERGDVLQLPILSAITFGLVTHWIATGIEFLVVSADGPDTAKLLESIESLTTKGQTHLLSQLPFSKLQWWTGTTALILDPIKTLVFMLFVAVPLYLSCLIFAPKRDGLDSRSPMMEDAIRIVSYSYAGTLFKPIPYIGWLIELCFVFAVSVAGIQTIYGASRNRAVWILIFPELVLMMSVFVATIVFVVYLPSLIFG